jgi:DNA polymerase-3 subunit beta
MFIEKIDKDEFLKQLQTVVGIVERKQPLPILSNVLINKHSSSIELIATDLEIQIKTKKELVMNSEIASITVSAKKLQEILRVLPEKSNVSFDLQENKFLIKANKSRFSLQTLPAKDFPLISDQSISTTKISIKQGLLKRLIGLVQYAMAQQDIRYYLNGVLLLIEGNEIKLIATDGHRLAYVSSKIENSYDKYEVILSRKTVSELSKLLVDSDELVKVELAEKQVILSFSNIVLTSKIIDGKFPDYERVIPNYNNHLDLDRLTILQALQRVAILSNEKFRGVRFVLTEKTLKIISSNSEQEEAQEEIENDYHGPALDIGFNVNYLLDGLNSTSSQMVTFSFGDPNSSILITVAGDNDYKYVVMPMRI